MRYDNKSTGKDSDLVSSIKAIVIGTSVGALACIAFLFLFSFIIVRTNSLPGSLIEGMVIAICAIGAFLAGYVAVRIYKSKGMLYGMAAGLLLFLIILLCSSIILKGGTITMMAFIKGILMVLLGAIGGIFGVNKRKRRK